MRVTKGFKLTDPSLLKIILSTKKVRIKSVQCYDNV